MENLDKKTQKKLLNIAEIHQNGPIAVIKKIIEFDDTLEDGIEKIGETIEKVDEKITELTEKVDSKLSEVKDGENYILTDEDKKEIVSLIEVPKPIKGEKGEKGKDGKDGKNGETPDTEELVLQVLSQIELPEYKETILDNGDQIITKINDSEEVIKAERVEGFTGYTDEIKTLQNRTQLLLQISTQRSNGGSSVGAFTDLTDVPSSYAGQGTKFVRVNGAETALEFATVSGGGDALTSAPLSQFASTTSAQLAGVISDETGTGSLVFANSPTLVTPALGTPSALVGTNITGTAAGLSIGGNAATVTVADAGGDTTTFPMLATSATGSLAPATDAGLSYNATTNALTTTTFIGALTGNADTATSATSASTATTLTGLTSSVAELNILDGVTATATELNYVDGVTSAIQTQIDAKANSAGALTQFVGNNTWKVWYSDASGDVQELALGADGTFLKSNGAALAPSFATPAGSGDVSKVGTPVNNQVGVWTGDGTIEGTTGLTYDGSNFLLTGDIGATGTRVTKGWFTDLQVTNAIAGSVTGNAATVTTNANLTGVVTSTGNATAIADSALSIAKTSGLQTALDSKLDLAGGTMTGNITLGENASIDLDPAGSADGKYTGTAITGTAGATLAFGDLIYLDPTDSRWELTDANAASGADGDARGIIGICVLAAAADGSATKILLNGVVRADTAFPAMTINAPMYVSETAGDITGTVPTTTDNVIRCVGKALTADELFFNPSSDWATHV